MYEKPELVKLSKVKRWWLKMSGRRFIGIDYGAEESAWAEMYIDDNGVVIVTRTGEGKPPN